MDLLELMIVLEVLKFIIGTTLTAFGVMIFHGLRIYFLIRKNRNLQK
ncbi:hypothetical protein [Terribacillus halophilus]|nr:hypothetical protein [Terribacillus halophilus]